MDMIWFRVLGMVWFWVLDSDLFDSLSADDGVFFSQRAMQLERFYTEKRIALERLLAAAKKD